MGTKNAAAARTKRKYVSTRDAADYLGVSMKTIRRYVAAGDLNGYRLGSSRLIKLDFDEVETLARKIPNARS